LTLIDQAVAKTALMIVKTALLEDANPCHDMKRALFLRFVSPRSTSATTGVVLKVPPKERPRHNDLAAKGLHQRPPSRAG
jgi:hypothetical protein